ncbi:hypothetical protein C8Q76DRAFT_824665 [Earliella scabrosa]|nr:hypothetical protein C8Q76DRAFT_824665 [Earliella scabrosa]
MTPTGCRPYGQTTYTKAVGRIQGKVGPSGLMNVAGSRDWPQLGGAGAGIDAEGNAQYQEVLVAAVDLTLHVDDSRPRTQLGSRRGSVTTLYGSRAGKYQPGQRDDDALPAGRGPV